MDGSGVRRPVGGHDRSPGRDTCARGLGFLVLVTPLLPTSAEAKEKQTPDSAMRSKYQCYYWQRWMRDPGLYPRPQSDFLILAHHMQAVGHPVRGNSTACPSLPTARSIARTHRACRWGAQADSSPSQVSPSQVGDSGAGQQPHCLQADRSESGQERTPTTQCLPTVVIGEVSVLSGKESGAWEKGGCCLSYALPSWGGSVPFLIAA